MHYKNGREAKDQDPVIGYDEYRKTYFAGVIHSLSAGSTSCNCQVAVPTLGGCMNRCETVGKLVHAEDGWKNTPVAVTEPAQGQDKPLIINQGENPVGKDTL